MSGSAQRALRILETIGTADRPLGVTEIARQLGIAAGTVFRSLDALERGLYIGRYQSSSRYIPGASAARLRQSLFARFHIRAICLPYLRQLAFASGETTALYVPVGWYGIRIAAAPGTNEVINAPPLGEVRTLAQGCASKAILATLPEGAARYRDWAERRGLRPGAVKPLATELNEIAARGYALEATEFAAGRASLALPIRGPERAIAAIAIEGPVLDLAHPQEREDLPRWIEIVQRIESLVRAQPDLFINPFDHIDAEEIVLRTGS